MVRSEVIRRRLNRLDEYIQVLTRLQRYSLEEFLADPERYGSAERFLHLAIEAVLGMRNHVVAEEGLGVVNWYSDIPNILAEKGYLASGLRDSWIQMIGFRNTLVHEYVDIDRKIVYEVLHQGVEDLIHLRGVFARFL